MGVSQNLCVIDCQYGSLSKCMRDGGVWESLEMHV